MHFFSNTYLKPNISSPPPPPPQTHTIHTRTHAHTHTHTSYHAYLLECAAQVLDVPRVAAVRSAERRMPRGQARRPPLRSGSHRKDKGHAMLLIARGAEEGDPHGGEGGHGVASGMRVPPTPFFILPSRCCSPHWTFSPLRVFSVFFLVPCSHLIIVRHSLRTAHSEALSRRNCPQFRP